MTLAAILLATLTAGIGSVWVADFLLRSKLGRNRAGHAQQSLLSLAAGALLATAFMHLLPEAFESPAPPQHLFTTLLVGIVFFFLLTKAELWHHGHEHAHSHSHSPVPPTDIKNLHEHGHGHEQHHHSHHHHGSGGWSLLTGDSVHCFGDGVLIASAFLADMRLGLIAAISVLAHEVPHHMGDLVVMSQGRGRRRAMLKVSLAGAVTALGGLCGYFLVAKLNGWLPFFLTIACSSFIYVALSDLIPQLQKQLSARQTLEQVFYLLIGIILVTAASQWAHHWGHEHGAEHGHEDGHSHSHSHSHSAAHNTHSHSAPLAPHAQHAEENHTHHDHDHADDHHEHDEHHEH